MWDTHISALGGWPTVSARFLPTIMGEIYLFLNSPKSVGRNGKNAFSLTAAYGVVKVPLCTPSPAPVTVRCWYGTRTVGDTSCQQSCPTASVDSVGALRS